MTRTEALEAAEEIGFQDRVLGFDMAHLAQKLGQVKASEADRENEIREMWRCHMDGAGDWSEVLSVITETEAHDAWEHGVRRMIEVWNTPFRPGLSKDLALGGVEMVDKDPFKVSCNACGAWWFPPLLRNGEWTTGDWYYCPNGCNAEKGGERF